MSLRPMPDPTGTSPAISDDDPALMRAIAGRQSEALRKLYQRHAPVILALCTRITGSVADGEEVTLEVFMEIWQRADRYDAARANPLTYLTMVARSRALDRRRTHRKTGGVVDPPADEPSQEAWVGPLAHLLAGEKRQSVRAALDTLADDERVLIEACFFDGLTHQQIAERTHQPLGTIKTRIRRGMARLRTRLRGLWDELPKPRERAEGVATETTDESTSTDAVSQSTTDPEVV
ncbi:MAG: sigma-70 family RNA polymerase sigma factor [Phycisphaerae bacterium]|nr:sigma-70 family RNA polymerase sigma factor [Phycisphaerae bacterium]